MLAIPMLTAEQSAEVQETRKSAGWQHIVEPIIVSIDLAERALINWEWTRGEDGTVTNKSVLEYEKQQMELHLMKAFLAFTQNNDIIQEEDREIFANTSK